MSECNFTSLIEAKEYIGDSLLTINANTTALDIGVCDISKSIDILEDMKTSFIQSVENMSNALYNLFSNANSGNTNHLYSNLNVLVSTISAGNVALSGGTGTTVGTITLSALNIPTSASVIMLSGYPVGCDGTILFTINGINVSDVLFAINNSESYKYVWYYNTSCLNQTYKIYLMGYI